MNVTLTAESGRPLGSSASRRLRREGRIPAVVYGLGGDPVPVSVPWTELRQALTTEAGMNALIDLRVDGQRALTIVWDLQRDHLKRAVTHVDFLRIDPEAELEVEVPITLTGEPEDLTHEGGLVDQVLYSILVRAKPDAIPNELEVDITDISLEEPVTVAQLTMPEGVATDLDPEEPIATGYIPRAVIEEEEAEEAEEGELEVEGEAAPEGEEAEAEGEAEAGGDDSEG